MFKTEVNFKIGQLNILSNQVFEIEEQDNQLNFYIEGIDNNKNKYSISFITKISSTELLNFNLNDIIDFIPYVDKYDIVFEKNGIFDLNIEAKMKIMRYLTNKFLLNISFKDSYDIVGEIELNFSINYT